MNVILLKEYNKEYIKHRNEKKKEKMTCECGSLNIEPGRPNNAYAKKCIY